MNQVLIAHISDFHIFADVPQSRLVRRDVADAARKVVADIAAFRPAIDAVMFTGDLADGGSPQDYALLKSILTPLDVPVFAVPGNHDRREAMRAAFADTLPFDDGGLLNFDLHFGALRLIGLDTLIEGRDEGCLETQTLDWLEGRLADPCTGPTYLLMHHPPFPSGIHALDAISLVDGVERLAAIVGGYPGKLCILSGHIHRPYQAIWNGALAAVAGSPAFQVALDLTPGAGEPDRVEEPYRYFIHRIEGNCISILGRYVRL